MHPINRKTLQSFGGDGTYHFHRGLQIIYTCRLVVNRLGKTRTYINLFITMLLGGLWHGANWTFVVWGAMHGLALAVHKKWIEWYPPIEGKQTQRWLNIVFVLLTFHFVCFTWIFLKPICLPPPLIFYTRYFIIFMCRAGQNLVPTMHRC
nr:hypothetical protein [Bacteroidota bacterium]